jgi:hypothetical protein
MAKVYAALIRKGLKTLDDVPANLRDAVLPSCWRRAPMRELRLRLALFLLRKEVQDMAVVYATLIIKGRKTIDQVPALLRKQVEEILADLEVEV